MYGQVLSAIIAAQVRQPDVPPTAGVQISGGEMAGVCGLGAGQPAGAGVSAPGDGQAQWGPAACLGGQVGADAAVGRAAGG